MNICRDAKSTCPPPIGPTVRLSSTSQRFGKASSLPGKMPATYRDTDAVNRSPHTTPIRVVLRSVFTRGKLARHNRFVLPIQATITSYHCKTVCLPWRQCPDSFDIIQWVFASLHQRVKVKLHTIADWMGSTLARVHQQNSDESPRTRTQPNTYFIALTVICRVLMNHFDDPKTLQLSRTILASLVLGYSAKNPGTFAYASA
jgi:hypothetical protein